MVEILVAIVLLGVVAVATLVTLTTSTKGSAVARDHANAHAWLQTATDVLYGKELQDCGTLADSPAVASAKAEEVAAAYEAIVRLTSNPEDWAPSQISVVRPVLFWDGVDEYQSTCYDDGGITLQLITLQVRRPDGRIVESVQVVKG